MAVVWPHSNHYGTFWFIPCGWWSHHLSNLDGSFVTPYILTYLCCGEVWSDEVTPSTDGRLDSVVYMQDMALRM